MRLPDFLVIGTQKAGTTWLGDMLHQHPDIFVAPREIHFFDKECNFRKGIEWYASHFDAAGGRKAVGEKTPEYFWPNGRGTDGHRPDVHRLLHRELPHARLIVILRDPVERAVSAARHLVMTGWVSPFLSLDDLLVGKARDQADGHGVVDYGFYARHLEAYLELFPREQILVLVYEEDVVADPVSGLRRTCEFLGVDARFGFRDVRERRNQPRRSLQRLVVDYYARRLRTRSAFLDRIFRDARLRASPSTLHRLRELYADENERLYRLLDRRLDSWDPAAAARDARDREARP